MKKMNVLIATGMLSLGLIGCGNQNASSDITSADNASSDLTWQNIAVDEPSSSLSSLYETNSITVNSSEKVTVVPDIAQVVYSVRTQAREAADCQQKNAEAVSQVIELLKNLDIEEKSIQTSDYYMNPVYNYSGNTARITGYEADTTLTVSDLPIDGLDHILSQSVSTGINTIESITYQASKYDESYQKALSSAVSTAYEKAQVLAQAAGSSVGKVISIQETSGYSQARYTDNALANTYRSASAEKLMDLSDTAGAIMPGEIQVEASIIVEYQLY